MVNETSSANYSNFKVYTPNKKEWEQHLSEDLFEDRELNCREYENAYVLSLRPHGDYICETGYTGGICDENGRFISGYVREFDNEGNPLKTFFTINDSYNFAKEKVNYIDEDCIYGGMAITFFGHTLTDSMTFLWYTAECGNANAKIIFHAPGNRPPSEAFYNLMEIMGIKRNRIIIIDKKVYKVRKLYIPDQSFYFNGSYTKKMVAMFDNAAAGCSKEYKGQVYKKIYLTRNSLPSPHGYNEEYFEDFYRKRGYTVLALEKLPMVDQIAIIANAEEIACLLGSLPIVAATFAQKLKYITILVRINDVGTVKVFQKFLQARNVEAAYIDVSNNVFPTEFAGGIYYVGPTFYWKQYLDENNIDYDADEITMNWSYLKNYMTDYALDYSQKKRSVFNEVKNMDFFDAMDRLNYVLNEKRLNRVEMGIKPKLQSAEMLSIIDFPSYLRLGKFSRFIVLFILDRNLWRDKIKSKLKNHKILLGFAKGVNKVLKKIRILKH